MDDSDSHLVARAQAGDVDAFSLLVDRHYADCLRFATRMLGDRADAEEGVQDAFVRAYRSLRRYDHRDQFRAWLFRILVNRCRSTLARRARRRRLLADREMAPAPDPGPDEPPGSRDRWIREQVERGLARLPPEQREAFLLKHLEELSYDEMAALTGVGVSALKMRVKRACERLRLILEEVVHDR